MATEAQIEALAREIAANEDSAVATGKRILDVLFDGDFGVFQSHNPAKEHSLSRLAAMTGRGRTTLSYRVKVAEQYKRYDAQYRDELPFSHHVALLQAAPEVRNALMRRAVTEQLSVRELQRLIRPGRGAVPERLTPLGRILLDGDKLQFWAEKAAREPSALDAALLEVDGALAILKQVRKTLLEARRQTRGAT